MINGGMAPWRALFKKSLRCQTLDNFQAFPILPEFLIMPRFRHVRLKTGAQKQGIVEGQLTLIPNG
jgi:hypothetical protein